MQIWKLEFLSNPKQSLSLQHVFLRGINEIPPDHKGEWIRIPRNRWDTSGPNYSDFHIGRLERYLDVKGKIKKAVAYGKNAEFLKTWFHFEDIKNYLGNWVLPEVPYWYNNQIFVDRLRKEHEPKKENNSTNQNQGKKKGNPKQDLYTPHRGYDEKKIPDAPRRPYNSNVPVRPQDPRKDSSKDQYRSYEHRRGNSEERYSRQDTGFIRRELDEYYDPRGEPDLNYEPRDYNSNRHRYREDDRYFHEEDSPRNYPGIGRGEGQRDRADRARNPGPDSRDHYRDSSRDSHRNGIGEDRRSNRSPSRDRGRGYGASRAKQHDYGKTRRS